MKWLLRIAVAGILVLVLWQVWQRVFVTDEQRIKKLISTMVNAVEKADLLRLSDALASDYSDDYGLDKTALLGAVRSYRQQHDGLFIHLSDVSVELQPDHQNAKAMFIAKVVVKPKSDGETQLISDRFRLFFRKTDQGWKLYRTESPELKFD